MFITIGLVLVAVAAILAAIGVWLVRRPWPQVNGTIDLPGLSAPVEVIRDQWGVPHIYASNEHDLIYAQGYVHAQDRLWQMEFQRRVAGGMLSAFLGKSALQMDRLTRAIGLRRSAENDWAVLDDDTRDMLSAYAEGVNAYIETHRRRLPLEFTILRLDPTPWSPIDTLSWSKMMCHDVCHNYKFELVRARIVAKLGEEAAQELMPPYAEGAPIIMPPEVCEYAWLRGASHEEHDGVAAFLHDPGIDRGSNNWVVHGSRTATGMPLLANDMHLVLSMPCIWYEVGLHAGRFDSVGFSTPGAPLVIVGHNSRIAWGVSNMGSDVQDFYIEKLNDLHRPTQFASAGEWHDLEIAHEIIDVKGQEPVQLDVLITSHGPIVNDAFEVLEDAEPMALRWVALDGSRLFRAVALLNQARNWEEFRHAISYWDVPSQNFVYADVDGNIGYQSSGKTPIRVPGHSGLLPVPGWTGEYDWKGFIPYDDMPSVLNPPAGYIVTANNKVVPDDYPCHLSYEWAAPFRAQRAIDLLADEEDATIETMRRIQADSYSLPAEAMRPYLLALDPEDDLQARALALVEAWDLHCDADQAGAAVYQAWLWFVVKNLLGDELGDELIKDYMFYYSAIVAEMIEWLARPDTRWFNDVSTPQVETRDDILRRSLADAVGWLIKHHGPTPERWQWGRLQTMTFVHQPFGHCGIRPVERLFNTKTVAARGDAFTVNAAAYQFEKPFVMRAGVSQRQIIDLSDLENSLAIHSTGQNGQLFHPHREDFVSAWQNVEYHPMLFGRDVVAANAKRILTLTPL